MTKSQALAAVVEAARNSLKVAERKLPDFPMPLSAMNDTEAGIAHPACIAAGNLTSIKDWLAQALAAYDAAPDAPQDAEVREGIARIIGEETNEWASVYYETADAILEYLHSQGFRRVGEGEVVVPREPTKAMLLKSNPNIGTYLGTQMEIDAAHHKTVEMWRAMLSASERA